MKMQERINELFQRYLTGDCSPAEWEELLILASALEEDDPEALAEPLRQLWLKAGQGELAGQTPVLDKEKLYQAVIHSPEQAPVRRIRWWRVAAAAIFIGVVVIGGVMFFHHDSQPVSMTTGKADAAEHIGPGVDKAVLTLADGRQVALDSSTGAISGQGNVKVTNLPGQLAYEAPQAHAGSDVLYNTMTTPRASQYRLVLQDGTKVWLNAASSIRYPTAFTGPTRTVDITGEAYFEVAKDRAKPFRVRVKDVEVDVLGTRFNVNAYTDERVLKTSLLEGAVRVVKGEAVAMLAPGQEASLTSSGLLSSGQADVDMSVAWVKGYFQFDQAPLPEVMRQVGRWYDLDIRYEGAVPDRLFKGKIQRSLPLSGILHLLGNGGLKFRVEGRTLVVVR